MIVQMLYINTTLTQSYIFIDIQSINIMSIIIYLPIPLSIIAEVDAQSTITSPAIPLLPHE